MKPLVGKGLAGSPLEGDGDGDSTRFDDLGLEAAADGAAPAGSGTGAGLGVELAAQDPPHQDSHSRVQGVASGPGNKGVDMDPLRRRMTDRSVAAENHPQSPGDGDDSDPDLWTKLRAILPISRHMASMAAVYFLEYTVNTGVASTLGFPRDGVSPHVFYVRSNFAYQIGVFLSRTFGESIPMPWGELWPLPALQLVNLGLFLG